MLHLVKIIDQALGYVPPSTSSTSLPSSHSHPHSHSHAHEPAPPLSSLSSLYHTSTIQEKWIDHPEAYALFEREAWKKEGDEVMKEANERSLKESGADSAFVEKRREELRRQAEEAEAEGEGMDVGEEGEVI